MRLVTLGVGAADSPRYAPAGLRSQLRRLAAERGLRPYAGSFQRAELRIDARPVVHTGHPAFGYRIKAPEGTVVWAPEFFEFPGWAHGVELMFAEAAGWERPIRFAGGVGESSLCSGSLPATASCSGSRAGDSLGWSIPSLGATGPVSRPPVAPSPGATRARTRPR